MEISTGPFRFEREDNTGKIHSHFLVANSYRLSALQKIYKYCLKCGGDNFTSNDVWNRSGDSVVYTRSILVCKKNDCNRVRRIVSQHVPQCFKSYVPGDSSVYNAVKFKAPKGFTFSAIEMLRLYEETSSEASG